MTLASAVQRDGSWDVARTIAAHDLVTTSEHVRSVAPRNWTELLTVLCEHRCCGVALHAADTGVLDLNRAQYLELLEHHETQLALDLSIERLVLVAFDALSTANIDARLLKGASTSRRFYDDPSLRSFGDADILVPRHEFRRAISIFEDLGYSRATQPPRQWFNSYVKGACLATKQGLELDLHQMLAPGPYGFVIGTNVIFERAADHVDIGPVSVPCLPAAMSFVHACVHVTLGDPYPRLTSLRDVIATLRSGVHAEEVAELVEAWNVATVVARALSLVDSVLGWRLRGAVAERYWSYRPTRRDMWRLSAYQGDGARSVRQYAAGLWELPSLRDKIAYAAALAVPNREYVRARATSRPRRVRQAASLAMKWRPR